MTNYEAIIKMPPDRMEQFLDQVYLAGMNNGMHAVRQKDDDILDRNPFDSGCLLKQRKQPRPDLTKRGKNICFLLSWKQSAEMRGSTYKKIPFSVAFRIPRAALKPSAVALYFPNSIARDMMKKTAEEPRCFP